ncbi:hypothetical protein GCM10007424_11740 [Flavobacterium suaedae]|uniref:Uncharacterized protein n=1 Tax=Flavobacterium suaedae TaxID=1767027 RepID=A0ABQ1JNG0_9FLAO|nr:hypothetical protein [Flavobacterium suaedae]GGB73482.1 hypothetical protein GCM10007424_11740 [Flavobacterium suaedae]
MRHYLLFILFFSFTNLGAQSVSNDSILPPVKKDLSEEELQMAVDSYLQMTKSETYKQFKKNLRENSIKLKGLDYPPDLKTSDKESIEKWLINNIEKTKYSSVKEGVEMIHKSYLLMQKLYKENTEVYTFMRRATKEQLREIIAPERNTFYDY